MVLPVVQFNAHKKGKKGLTVFYNCKLHNFVSGSRVYTCIQITLYYFINQLWPAFAKQKAREVSLIIVYIGVCLLCAEPSVPLEAKGQMFFFFFCFWRDHDFKTVCRRILPLSLPRSLLSNDVRCIQLCTTSLQEDI